MTRPEVLKVVGVSRQPSQATWRLVLSEGRVREVVLPASTRPAKPAWRFAGGRPPISERHPDEALWFEVWPESRAVYANFRSYDDLAAHVAKLMATLDHEKPTRFILDMRDNGGGDFTKVRDLLIPEIVKRPWLNKRGTLFVLINRYVFSAAMTNVIDLRLRTKATLVGEPIGERPNSWQEVRNFTLPKSGLTVRYSTKYYRNLPGDPDAVYPSVRIDPDFASYNAPRDRAIQWVLRHKASGRAAK